MIELNAIALKMYEKLKKNTGYLYFKNGHLYKKSGLKNVTCYNKECKGSGRLEKDDLIQNVITHYLVKFNIIQLFFKVNKNCHLETF